MVQKFTHYPLLRTVSAKEQSYKPILFFKYLALVILLMVSVLLPKLSRAQTALTIGTGTSTSSYYPIYTFYGYNYSQSTYLASEIVAAGATAGTPGFISSISYYATSYYSDFSTKCKDWVIYMGNTSKSTFSGTTDWVAYSGLTKVFDGVAPCTGTGWFKITFPTPFYWDGTSNLVIAVDENTPDFTSTMPWQTTTRTGTRSISYYNDGTNPDPVSPPTANTTYAGTPDIKIDYLVATPCSGTTAGGTAAASATSLCPGTSAAVSVTGSTLGTGLTYQWESAPASTGPWTTISGATASAYTVSPPTATTTYYRRKITCTSTSSAAYSTPVAISVSSVLNPPYTETFEGVTPGNNVPCATASPSFSSGVTVYSGYDNWKLIADVTTPYASSNHTTGGANYLVAGYNIGTYVATADYWFTPGINLASGKTYRFSYWHRMGTYASTSYSGGIDIGMYWSTAPSKTATLNAIKPDLTSRSNSAYEQNVGDFSVPANGVYYLSIKANNKNFGGYYCAGTFDDLNLIELPACNTATASTFGSGGKALATPSVVCSVPSTTTLSVSSTPPFSGLAFSWEVATGTPSSFAATAGVTATYTHSIAAAGVYYFRCKVTCTASGLTTYSDTVQVRTVPLSLPYVETFESGTDGVNMPCASNTYSWGDNYWWIRSGVHPYASGITNHTPGGKRYLHAGIYLGNASSGADEYWFTPGLALTAAKAYNVSFWYSNAAYSSSYATYPTEIGIRVGSVQTKAGMTITAGADSTVYINSVLTPTYNQFKRGFIAPTTGTYYVGIKVNHNTAYCYYGMAIDDIGVDQIAPCSAKPSAGYASASPSLICTTGTSTISLLGISLASDLSFQWESSTTSASTGFTPITGATAASYTTGTLSAGPVWYRCIVKCGAIAAPNTDTSIAAIVSVGALTLPYTENFETGTVGVNMPCASYAGTWSSSIQYWYLRSGAYSSSYPGVKNHTPGGSKYIYSGYYNGPYYSTGENFFWFTPALKMTAGKAYQVGFWYNGTGYTTGTNGLKLGIYAGTAQTAAGMTIRVGGPDSSVDASKDKYNQMVRSFVAPSTGNYYIGIKTVHTGYNYPGIPLDDINVSQLPDCSSKPTAGFADATPVIICSSGTTRLALSGTSISSGITYKWLESTTGAAGSFVASSTGSGFTTGYYTTGTLTTSRWYKCVVTCSITGQVDTSTVVAVNVGGITPPYRETFELVTPGTNAPCASYSSTWGTSSSTNYWTTKGFDYTGYGTIHTNHTPGGSNYLWAGYYFGYSPSAGAMWFTPAIKLVKDSTYEFSYWYMGPGYYYYNSGVEMGMYYGTAQTEAAMTTAIRPLFTDKRSNYKQLIGRFKAIGTGNYYMGIKIKHTYSAYSYYGTALDDIALDQLSACSGMPTAGTIFATPDQLCSAGTVALDMDYSNVTKASGLTYRWESSTISATAGFSSLSGALSAPNYTTGTISVLTWFRCIVKCTNTGDSVISAPIKVDVGIVMPPYFQTFEGVNQGSNAPCASTTNTFSASSLTYWGVYRVPISTSYTAIYNHTNKGTAYLMAGYALGNYSSGKDEYWFTPRIQLTGGKVYQFAYWYSGSGYSGGQTDLSAAYGTTNTAAGMTSTIGTPLVNVNVSAYKKYAGIFSPATSGAYYMAIKVNHKVYSYPGIAFDDISLQEVPPCSAPVVAGLITATPNHICTVGGSALLDLEGSTLATGLNYVWYASSAPTGPFVATGGTGLPYTTDPLTTNTWFKCVVSCGSTGASDTTKAFKVGVGGFDLPYIEDFESTPAGQKPLCSDATDWGTYYYDAWNVYAGTYTGSYTNHTPGGTKHLIGGYYLGYSSYTPTYPTVTDDNYWFSPGLNMRSGYKYKISFWYLAAHPSYPSGNRMGVFYGKTQAVGAMSGVIAPFKVYTNTSYEQLDTTFTVPTSGVYYLGFKKSNSTSLGASLSAYGVAFDDINVNYAPCDGRPIAGVITSTTPSGTGKCLGTPMTLVDIGATINLVPGIQYQWQRKSLGSTGSTSWTTVFGATDTILKADTLVGYEYRFGVICGNTGDTAYSGSFQIPQLTPHPAVTINPSTTPVTYCLGDSVKFTATGFAGAIYDWMLDSVVIPGWKFSDLGATNAGTYMVRVSSALSPCPGYSNQVELIINDPGYSVSITKPADSIICAGTSMLLSATASKSGVTYQWRKDNIDISGANTSSYLVTTGGYYRVMVYDGSSTCQAASGNVKITVKPNPPAVISLPGGTTTACENEGVLLSANTGGFSYEWRRSGSPIVGWTDSNQLVKNSGVYSVKVRSSDGCASVSADVTVNILPSPIPVIAKSGLTLGTTTTYINYQWIRNNVDMTGETSATLGLTKKGFYKVRVKDANGCEGESTPIEVMDDGLSIGNTTINTETIRLYPNPTQSKVYIESPVSVMVTVKDVTGRTIISSTETKEIDLSKYADGVYLFMLSDKEGNELIKQQRVSKLTSK